MFPGRERALDEQCMHITNDRNVKIGTEKNNDEAESVALQTLNKYYWLKSVFLLLYLVQTVDCLLSSSYQMETRSAEFKNHAVDGVINPISPMSYTSFACFGNTQHVSPLFLLRWNRHGQLHICLNAKIDTIYQKRTSI